jgi:two-component system, chemotaxis family, sensor kinase CheA
MNASFENFQSKFIEEALDNISDLEKALLELELSPGNKELVERVFRVMHSLKGGGAMFGFDKLSEFTHLMENIYDRVRAGHLSVTPKLLSITLNSVDMLRELLDKNALNNADIKQRFDKLEIEMGEVIKQEAQMVIASASSNKKNFSEMQAGQMATYYIHFYPEKHIPENGTNLLYLIDELKSLGSLFAIPGTRNIPGLEELEPENSYLFWDLFLATDQGQCAILDVFIFVEDESVVEIHKISNSNLFSNKQFDKRLKDLCLKQNEIELSDFTDFMGAATSLNTVEAQVEKPAISKQEVANGRSLSSIRVSSEKIDGLMNLVSELVITQERLSMIASRHQIPELKMVTESVQKLTGALRDSTFSISLIPVESLITRFQRLVRDLSSSLGKQINFTAIGTETELDKTMIESLTDPLLHIIRNSIDHGIESPEIRQKNNKPQVGNISLEASYSGANVVIRIKDDGAGIDPQKVYRKALEKALVSSDQHLSNDEILNLVFMPGFSTSSVVTEVSGRGVGMDVVRRNIAAIRGEVSIESSLNVGTTITITLPLVLSIIDGLLVRINKAKYVIPLSLTDRIYPIESKLLDNNFINVVNLEGVQVPFFNLRKELNLTGEPPTRSQVVVVNHHESKMAMSVDQVLGKIQAVLKPLGRLYHEQKVISAATIMGDGSIALVLDTNTIVKQLLIQQ